MKRNYYFLGIGGIGMSALARYFLHEGHAVAGYDRTETALTRRLVDEGAFVHYRTGTEAIPEPFRDRATTTVIYTPAVPDDHAELHWFRDRGFEVLKRSQMLGHLAEGHEVVAVAGTHGKTTTTTMIAWLDRVVTGEGSAFLGGISRNFSSNLVLGDGRRLAVEADEYDRSFLSLHPDVAVVTSVDPDHLDIYGTYEAVQEAFCRFIRQIRPGGTLILRRGVELPSLPQGIALYRYAAEGEADFTARRIRPGEGACCRFDLLLPDQRIDECTLGVPGRVNVENSVAAVAALWAAERAAGHQLDEARVREALGSFRGVKRRFEVWVSTPRGVYMDDYAHHPRELEAALTSLRAMYPGRRITALFQPHLYTRTRDLAEGFGRSLSLADEAVLLPVYPAREEPIPGVGPELIARHLTVPHAIVEREALAGWVAEHPTDVVATFGAGNIDQCAEAVAAAVRAKG